MYSLTQLPAMCLDQRSHGMPKQRALSSQFERHAQIAAHRMHRNVFFQRLSKQVVQLFRRGKAAVGTFRFSIQPACCAALCSDLYVFPGLDL